MTVADMVAESATTTGTGTVNLAGAMTGYRTFVAGVGNGNSCTYQIKMGAEWEIGVGTVTSGSPDTLSRDAVYSSSNAGSLVDFSAGTKTVVLVLSSTEINLLKAKAPVATQAKGSVSGAQTLDLTTYKAISLTVGGAMSLNLTGTYAANTLYTTKVNITNGNAYAITWPAKFKFVSGSPPTLTTAGIDSLVFTVEDGSGSLCEVYVNGLDVKRT